MNRFLCAKVSAATCLLMSIISSAAQANLDDATPQKTVENPVGGFWNDSHDFGFYISNNYGPCDHGRGYSSNEFLAIDFGQSAATRYVRGESSTENVKLCAAFHFGHSPPFVKCATGSISYDFDKNSQTYKGSYEITLTNGAHLGGNYLVNYCKPIH